MRSVLLSALSLLLLSSMGRSSPAGAQPTLALHVQEVSDNQTICTASPNDAGIPCSDYVTEWPADAGAYVYLVMARVESGGGVLSITCGIEYGDDPDIFQWTRCADLDFRTSGPNGEWPASGGGNTISWGTCQNTEISPDGIHAVAGVFYVYSYGAGAIQLTPNNNLSGGARLYYADCEFSEHELLLDTPLGRVGFGGEAGFNPCAETQVMVDVLPGDCPNGIRPWGNRNVRAAVLGGSSFDVHDIALETVQLEGVSPRRGQIRDVSSPGTAASCCDRGGKDGLDDLLLIFPLDEFLAAVGAQPGDDALTVVLTGQLADGTAFSGDDCVRIEARPGRGQKEPLADTKPHITARHVPAMGVVLIQYALPEAEPVRLQVLDVQGRLLREMEVTGTEGTHTETWEVGNAPSGVYFTRLVGRTTVSSRVVVVR